MAEVEEKKKRRIAVAVDESEESMYALSWCLRNLLSGNTEDTLILFYVKPSPPVCSSLDRTRNIFSNDVIPTMEKFTNGLTDSVMERAKMVFQHFHNIKVEKNVGSGDAGVILCTMVEKLRPDMLVMGSHGYGFIKRALLGSVSDYCAKRAKCPVVIIKRPN
ncbi:universal stress protein PHOS34-like [Tasmannia lanceolata]|uniref:universal stress protein PHOS34-like n=1 Tax=Tasmannia lanceolata TaxID=3420 RepID=UPI004062D9B6